MIYSEEVDSAEETIALDVGANSTEAPAVSDPGDLLLAEWQWHNEVFKAPCLQTAQNPIEAWAKQAAVNLCKAEVGQYAVRRGTEIADHFAATSRVAIPKVTCYGHYDVQTYQATLNGVPVPMFTATARPAADHSCLLTMQIFIQRGRA
jgi:hypothetical protein